MSGTADSGTKARSFMNTGAVRVVAALAAVLLSVLLMIGGSAWKTVHNSTGARFLSSVEQELAEPEKTRDIVPFGKKEVSPLTSVLVLGASSLFEVSPSFAARLVGAVHLALLVLLLFLFCMLFVPWYFALLTTILFVLHPMACQGLFESVPYHSIMFYTLAPALLLGLAMSGRGLARFGLCLAAGLVAGLSVFAHHLGLWTALFAMMAMFLSETRDRSSGVVSLPPIGLEFLTTLLGFSVLFFLGKSLLGVTGKELSDFLFGPFRDFHVPIAVRGTVYREVLDGGPPMWTTAYLFVVRTPPLLLLGLAGGLFFAFRDLYNQRTGLLWLPGSSFLVLFTVATLSGSPLYMPGVNLLAMMSLFPAVMAGYALWALYRFVTRQGMRGGAFELAGMAVLSVFALGHQVYVDAVHMPYQSAYANVFGGGTGGFMMENDIFLEPTLDGEAAKAAIRNGPKVTVLPWGSRAQSVLDRFAWDSGVDRVQARNGGPFGALVFRHAASRHAALIRHYCNQWQAVASLNVDSVAVWQLFVP